MREFINNLIKNSSTFYSSIADSTKLITPVSVTRINRNLRGNYNVSSIFDYLSNDTKLHPIIKIYRNFENLIIRNPPMNPHKEYFPLSYYVWDKTLLGRFNSIINSINNGTFQKFIHLGNKGVGKTITQNCWLHENNEELEKNGIFWIRCDVHKIYKLWEKLIVNPNSLIMPVTIEQYIKIQFLYVFAKYIDKSNLFKEIYKQILEDDPVFVTRKSKNNEIDKEKVKIVKGIKEVIASIQTEKSKTKHYSYAMYLIEQALLEKNIKRFAFDRWISLSDAIQRIILDKGYKILKILDGLDNVEFLNSKGLKYYKIIVSDATDFVSSTPESGVFRFISMRPETFNDIRRNPSYSTDPEGFDAHYYTIEHRTPSLGNILEYRLISFFNRYNITSKSSTSCTLYVNILKNTYKIHDRFYESLEFFNNNIRLFLHSKLSLTLQVLFRYLQTNTNFSLKTFNNYHKVFFKRNLFLNGRLFLNTESSGLSNLKQGNSLYNIFYFDYHDIEINKVNCEWRGLCSTRLMQLLRRTNRTTKNRVITTLNNLFGYKKSYINKCFDRLITFGFITSYSDKKLRLVLYKMTDKGKIALDYIFSDLDILYYLSIDTPMPNQIVEKKFIKSHNNNVFQFDPNKNLPIPSYYPSSSIISTISFVLFIHFKNIAELDKLSDEDKKIFKDPFDIYSKKRIFKRLSYLYNTSNKEEKEIVNKYFSNLGLKKLMQKRNVLALTKK